MFNVFFLALTQLRCRRVLVLAGQHSGHVRSKCLFRFDDPVSPHLAARRANESGPGEVLFAAPPYIQSILTYSSSQRVVPTDDAFVNAVASHVRNCAEEVTAYSHMYVETAGGKRFNCSI